MGRTASVIVASALVAAGCSLGTGPELPADRFALAEIDGHPLPSRVGDRSWIADTIRFAVGGAWRRVEVFVRFGEDALPDPIRLETEGFVTRRGSRVVLDFTCGPAANCTAPDTLRIEGDALVRHLNHYDDAAVEDPEFRYAPIGPFF